MLEARNILGSGGDGPAVGVGDIKLGASRGFVE
jgi:hypothetical protein